MKPSLSSFIACACVLCTALLTLGGCTSSQTGDAASSSSTDGATQTSSDGLGVPPEASGTLNPSTLIVALLPDEDPATMLRENAGLQAYLSEKLGREIELKVHIDYNVMIEAMRTGHLHLAYFGPASYVLTRDAGTHIEPFVAKTKNGSTTYTSSVIAHADSGIASLADIAGKAVGFGDPASTSSHLIPRSLLRGAGLHLDQEYTASFLGSHDAVALNVASGSVAAGGLSSSILAKLLANGSITDEQVVVIAESPAYPQYPWTMRSDLDPSLKEAIREAFLELTDEAVLKPLHAQGFDVIDDNAYDVIRALQAEVDP